MAAARRLYRICRIGSGSTRGAPEVFGGHEGGPAHVEQTAVASGRTVTKDVVFGNGRVSAKHLDPNASVANDGITADLDDAGVVDNDAANVPITARHVVSELPAEAQIEAKKVATRHIVADGVPAAADIEAGTDVPKCDVFANRVSIADEEEAIIQVEPVVNGDIAHHRHIVRVINHDACTAGISDREALAPSTEHRSVRLDQHRSYLYAADIEHSDCSPVAGPQCKALVDLDHATTPAAYLRGFFPRLAKDAVPIQISIASWADLDGIALASISNGPVDGPTGSTEGTAGRAIHAIVRDVEGTGVNGPTPAYQHQSNHGER